MQKNCFKPILSSVNKRQTEFIDMSRAGKRNRLYHVIQNTEKPEAQTYATSRNSVNSDPANDHKFSLRMLSEYKMAPGNGGSEPWRSI